MRALFDALEAATRRRGRVVELVGEPGMGKSRMIEELITQAGGMTLLVARCELYETSSAYQPFRGLLRDVLGIRGHEDPAGAANRTRDRVGANAPHLLPWLPLLGIPMDIEMPMTPETEQLEEEFRRRRLEAVTEELLKLVLPTPTLFVFDDVHWMDEASADLLARMVAEAADRPWLILVTRRESDEGFKVPEGVDAVSLSLKPLDAADAARFLETSIGGRPLPPHELTALAERSGGNPLFLRELGAMAGSATLEQALPDTVEDLMTAEIDRLDPSDRTLLRHAAVLGATFPLSVLVEMLGESRNAPTSSPGGGWATSSRRWNPGRSASVTPCCETPRTRGCPTVADGSSTRRRATPSRGPRMTRPRIEPRSCPCTSSTPTATRMRGRTGGVAADRARGKHALEMPWRSTAERSMRRARSRGSPPVRSRMCTRHAATCSTAWGSTTRRSQLPGRPSPRRRRPARRIEALPQGGMVLGPRRALPAGARWVTRGRQALDGVDGVEAGKQRSRLSAWDSALRQGQGRYREVMAWCDLAIKEAEASGEREALAQAYFIMDWALVDLGRLEEATYSPRALEIYLELGNLGSAATVLNNMGMFAYFRGRWAEAIDLYQQGHDLRIKMGTPSMPRWGR